MKEENKQGLKIFIIGLIIIAVVFGGGYMYLKDYINKNKVEPCKCLAMSMAPNTLKFKEKDIKYWDNCLIEYHSLEMLERKCIEGPDFSYEEENDQKCEETFITKVINVI